MLKQENLAANFCGLLTRYYNYKQSAEEWRILGQEQDGSMLCSWVSKSLGETPNEQSNIGLFDPTEKSFHILYSFKCPTNCIQASVNRSKTALAFVLKTTSNKSSDNDTTTEFIYTAYIVEVQVQCITESAEPRLLLECGTQEQVMTQFLWQKEIESDKYKEDKLLLFIHNKTISVLTTIVEKSSDADRWSINYEKLTREIIVKHFVWAQWDPVAQALYYIHLKPKTKSSLEKDENKATEAAPSFTTTLSAHQFNKNTPRETVVSVQCRPYVESCCF